MKGRIIRERRTIEVRRVPHKRTETGGTVPDRDKPVTIEHVDLELEIDVESIWRYLGEKAARSITGRSVEGSGMITVKRIGVARFARKVTE